jgi:hypothetical protein
MSEAVPSRSIPDIRSLFCWYVDCREMHCRDTFARMNMNDQETVALIGDGSTAMPQTVLHE